MKTGASGPDIAENTGPSLAPRQSGWRELIDTPWLMIVVLFCVTAALGLPFLWASRGFSTLWKILLTIAVLIWTAIVLWLFWLVMAWALPIIWEALKDLFPWLGRAVG